MPAKCFKKVGILTEQTEYLIKHLTVGEQVSALIGFKKEHLRHTESVQGLGEVHFSRKDYPGKFNDLRQKVSQHKSIWVFYRLQ